MSRALATLPADAMVFVVNDAAVLSPTKTTSALVARAAERHPTFVVGAADLALDDGGPRAQLRPVRGHQLIATADGPLLAALGHRGLTPDALDSREPVSKISLMLKRSNMIQRRQSNSAFS